MWHLLLCSVANAGDLGLIPDLGRSPREGNGYTFQYSYLENSMDRGAWRATVHGGGGGHKESDMTERFSISIASSKELILETRKMVMKVLCGKTISKMLFLSHNLSCAIKSQQ